jgi:hypothetical protein
LTGQALAAIGGNGAFGDSVGSPTASGAIFAARAVQSRR